MKNYGLDAAHYFSSPGLAWDAMLKMAGVELELIQEREMNDIIDKGIKVGYETFHANMPSPITSTFPKRTITTFRHLLFSTWT